MIDVLLVPDNGSKTEDFLGNGNDSVVGITVRWAPEGRDATTS